MKLPIKKEYFDLIKSGEKTVEYRDAHITFICEETGEQIRKDIQYVLINHINHLPQYIRESGVLEDKWILQFTLDDLIEDNDGDL